MGFRERLLEVMAARRYINADVVELTGLGSGHVSMLLTGQREPSLAIAVRVARALSLSLDWLCDLPAATELTAEVVAEVRRLAEERAGAGVGDERRAAADRARAKQARARALFLEGDISHGEYERIKEECGAALAECVSPAYDVEAALGRLRDLAGVVGSGTLRQQRDIVAAVFDEIRVGEGRIQAAAPAEWLRPLVVLCHEVPPRELIGTSWRMLIW